MKKTLLILAFFAFCQLVSAQTVLTIGTGTATQKQPFGMYYGYERSATLYTGLTTSTLITSIGWYVNTGNPVGCPVKIYIKTTGSSTLTSSTWSVFKSGATLVFNFHQAFPVPLAIRQHQTRF